MTDVLPRAKIAALDRDLSDAFATTPFGTGGFYGETTKRFGRLLARSAHADALVEHPLILAVVENILAPFCDRIQLNVAQAIAVHPQAPAQLPHRDHDMWRAPVGETEYLVNIIWPLSAFSADNGATMIWPGSHGVHALDAEPAMQPVAAEMSPGSALLFLGSTLHGAGRNISRDVRRGVVIGYSLGWLKPYENQWLAYPPDVARTFTPSLAALVGYQQHRPNFGNYEGQCPSVLLHGEPDEPLGAIDALRPDQQTQLEAFLAEQRQTS
ncbi:phytanoyl-CoA dioxygenase family protein [Sphingomonas paeninsulae]|uniref:phytanoyl-CoA dioxygenase family protein n=1 Tax=Sphingomonas paeninsulae TaxID=2319844 RepID=UPI001EF011F7|nr:phytanoyl-CoA dioxygenase family protein [Sphingomonas paeninsulae]